MKCAIHKGIKGFSQFYDRIYQISRLRAVQTHTDVKVFTIDVNPLVKDMLLFSFG